VTEVFNNIDWKLLREQKSTLVLMSEDEWSKEKQDALIGIINLLDSFQDTAVSEGYAKVEEVFDLKGCPSCSSHNICPSYCAHGYMQCNDCGKEWLVGE
jgi:hypothetical protein